MEVYFFHGKYDGKEEKIIYKYEMQIYILQIHVQFIYIQLTYNMYVKNLPASAGDPGLFPGLEDHLEVKMATHSSIFVWRIPWIEEPSGLQSMGHKELDMTEVTEHECM